MRVLRVPRLSVCHADSSLATRDFRRKTKQNPPSSPGEVAFIAYYIWIMKLVSVDVKKNPTTSLTLTEKESELGKSDVNRTETISRYCPELIKYLFQVRFSKKEEEISGSDTALTIAVIRPRK